MHNLIVFSLLFRYSIEYLEHVLNHNATRPRTTAIERDRIHRRHVRLTKLIDEQRYRYDAVQDMLTTVDAITIWTPNIVRDLRNVLEGISRDSFETLDRDMRVLVSECMSEERDNKIELPPDAGSHPLVRGQVAARRQYAC